ncbi:MAG: hypothetical protein HY064_07365 [Bacteroidetes bacterium]|nr:hypothetical protein [Bacteroidota bacterium]
MNPDSAASLPFGIVKEIGSTRYVIAIDSAKFKTNNATFSAFMALEFPGATQKLCFSAQNINFNPKGVMPGPNTKLVLVSEHRISIGPKVTLVLKPDGYNYVEWDCNGFQSVNLKGYFEFDPGMIYPDPSSSPDSVVRASFQVHCTDLHNFVVQTSLAPFCIHGLKDVSFSVLDATADFSELNNAQGMIFPNGYDLSNCNNDPLMWTGFYIRQFRVKLPKELSKNGTRPEIIATNLVIDNSGVSGYFLGNNLFNCSQGSMSGWGFSVNSIGVNLVSNHINGGSMAGYVKLPVSENDSLHYAAAIFENLQSHETDYSFTISPASDVNANVLSAKLTLYNSSALTISKVNGKLKPRAVLNGMISFSHSDAEAKNIPFQQLTLVSEAPVLVGGTFGFTADNKKLGGFGFSISQIQIGLLNQQAAIAFDVGVNFTDNSSGGFSISVNGGFDIITRSSTVANASEGGNATKQKLEFDRLAVNNISVDYNCSPVQLHGTIIFKNNDPVYGKGFGGNISLMITPGLSSPAISSVWFGTVNNYRYFYVDAAVPFTVPIGGGASIYRFMGGVYYHMHRQDATALENQLYTSSFGNALAYVPDENISVGVKAGVTLGTSGSPKPCNGDIAFEMNFNSNGGINYLQLNGTVFFMTGITDRLNKSPQQLPATASLVMRYDFQNNALHAVMASQIHLPGISGNGTSIMHFDPQTWYVYIGRPQQRMMVNVAGIANFSAYFETGSVVDPMPPPPANVSAVVNTNGLNDQRDENAISNASGFVFGASFADGFHGIIGSEHWNVYYNFSAGAGFDIMVRDYGAHAHCANTTNTVGLDGWYAQGQAYAYLQGDIGVRGHVVHDFDITIISLSAAAILQARVPDPSWVGGAVGCDYDVLGGAVSGHADCYFESGSQCNIVQN